MDEIERPCKIVRLERRASEEKGDRRGYVKQCGLGLKGNDCGNEHERNRLNRISAPSPFFRLKEPVCDDGFNLLN